MLSTILKSSRAKTLRNQFVRTFAQVYSEGYHAPLNAEQTSSNYERFKANKLYLPDGPEFMDNQHEYQDKMVEYNRTFPTEVDKRVKLLKEIFAEIGENVVIETPINANWGCKHVHLGRNIYINSNVTFVDDDHIYIGDYTMFAPNVTIATAAHPILPSLRKQGYQYNLPVKIGKNVWIGAGVIVMPGVTIGDNSVIGAGSVVTNDIPENSVAMGVPCRVIREIGEHDKKYYYRNREIDI